MQLCTFYEIGSIRIPTHFHHHCKYIIIQNSRLIKNHQIIVQFNKLQPQSLTRKDSKFSQKVEPQIVQKWGKPQRHMKNKRIYFSTIFLISKFPKGVTVGNQHLELFYCRIPELQSQKMSCTYCLRVYFLSEFN
jgi:hypothetical protein